MLISLDPERSIQVSSDFRLLVAGVLRVFGRPAREQIIDRRVLPLLEWLESLRQIWEPVRVRSLRFTLGSESVFRRYGRSQEGPQSDGWRHQRMARRIGTRLVGHGAVTVVYPGQVTWYETTRVPLAISVKTLLSWGGGLVDAVANSTVKPNGPAALRAAQRAGVLRGCLGFTEAPAEALGAVEDVERSFRKMVPNGAVYCPEGRTPLPLDSVSARDRRSILFEAVHFARHLRGSGHRSRFDVTSLVADGELKSIFIADRACNRRQRARWRRVITRINIARALADPKKAQLLSCSS